MWTWQKSSSRNEHHEPSGKHLVHKLRSSSPPTSATSEPRLRHCAASCSSLWQQTKTWYAHARGIAGVRKPCERKRARSTNSNILNGVVEVNDAHSEPFVRRTGTVELALAPLRVQRHAASVQWSRALCGPARLPGAAPRPRVTTTVRDSRPQDLREYLCSSHTKSTLQHMDV